MIGSFGMIFKSLRQQLEVTNEIYIFKSKKVNNIVPSLSILTFVICYEDSAISCC